MAYATPQDVADVWRPLTSAEWSMAETLLDHAAIRIDAAKPPTAGLSDAAVRKVVACAMVKRAMLSAAGIAQQSQSAGGLFSQQVTYANPTGDLYLTKDERKLLGARRQQAGSVWMGPESL